MSASIVTTDIPNDAIASDTAALAYAIARMPATYAATRRALFALTQRAPDFAPRSLLDFGAGPGTATFAALSLWPSLEAVTLVEPNAHMRALAALFVANAEIRRGAERADRGNAAA